MGENTGNNQEKEMSFRSFAALQMLLWMVVAIVVIAGAAFVLKFFESPEATHMATPEIALHESGPAHSSAKEDVPPAVKQPQTGAGHSDVASKTEEIAPGQKTAVASHAEQLPQAHPPDKEAEFSSGQAAAPVTSPVHPTATAPPSKTAKPSEAHKTAAARTDHASASHGESAAEKESFPVIGMAFVNSVIQPLDYELNHRFYGWRPNDIVRITDNVNNFQLGVLEVTRRSTVILTERISRTGSTASFDKNLENAMNWFMIKADRYWFPAAETKYKAGLDELRIYFNNLKEGKAVFYTRTDNLIPLLAAYEDLLGSCDENLVKKEEKDGSPVSTFKADDYFYYSKGVVSAMVTILEAIQQDFNIMVTREGGMEVLHHAIESCHHAGEIEPWFIFNSDPSSIFANHRSNIAAPISHARFYLGVLIKALST
jgi:hypothetical protein